MRGSSTKVLWYKSCKVLDAADGGQEEAKRVRRKKKKRQKEKRRKKKTIHVMLSGIGPGGVPRPASRTKLENLTTWSRCSKDAKLRR